MNKNLEQIFKAKEAHRKRQAALSFEEKVNIVGKLQQRVLEAKSKVQFLSRARPTQKKSS